MGAVPARNPRRARPVAQARLFLDPAYLAYRRARLAIPALNPTTTTTTKDHR